MKSAQRRMRLKFFAWTVLCFIAATDAAGRFCHNRLNELYLLLEASLHRNVPEATSLLAQKGMHVFLYVLLGFFAANERDNRIRVLFYAAGASICILTEIFQSFTNTRHMSVLDMALNLAAFSIVPVWRAFSGRSPKEPAMA